MILIKLRDFCSYGCNSVGRMLGLGLIRFKPFTQIGKDFGVSDNAVRKWCKSYNLPTKTSDIKSINSNDWINL